MTPVTIPARHGIAVHLPASKSIKIINTYGTQVVDTWAFATSITTPSTCLQYLSMHHTHASLNKIIPEVGDTLTSNERKGMLTVVEDTTGGIHDTLVAACDKWRYEELGATGYHDNCADNLVEGLKGLGIIPPTFTPSPLNLFMNIPVHSDCRTISFEAPTCTKGGYIVLRAEMDLVIAFSACPQDILTINGGKTLDAHYELL